MNTEELKKYSKQRQVYMKQFGYPEVLDQFTPHLTLTRLKGQSAAKRIVNSLVFPYEELTVSQLAAITMGEYGTCKGIVKEWSLV